MVTLISCLAYVEGRLPCSEYSDCWRVFQKFSRNFPKASINISLNIAIATTHTCFWYVPVETYANPLLSTSAIGYGCQQRQKNQLMPEVRFKFVRAWSASALAVWTLVLIVSGKQVFAVVVAYAPRSPELGTL